MEKQESEIVCSLNEDIWKVIDNYFKVIDKPLSLTQLDSYNMFLQEQIPKTIRQFNPITCYYNDELRTDSTKNLFKFKIQFFIGSSWRNKLPDTKVF